MDHVLHMRQLLQGRGYIDPGFPNPGKEGDASTLQTECRPASVSHIARLLIGVAIGSVAAQSACSAKVHGKVH